MSDLKEEFVKQGTELKEKLLARVYTQSKFVVKNLFYLHVKQSLAGDRVIETEPVYKLWLCSFGEGNPHFLILTNHVAELPLGDCEKCLIQPDPMELVEYFNKNGIPQPETIERICKALHIKPVEDGDKINYNATWTEIIKLGKIYKLTLPIKNEYFQFLLKNPEKLQEEIDFFLTEGCDKDSKILFWGKSRLIKVSDDLNDHWIEKYRGHALVIKPPKCGFSTLSDKLGRNITYTTSASVRGFADAQGTIRHGVFHSNFGHIGLDEASKYKEIVSDVALTFMELGKHESTTAGVKIVDYGAPAITIICNAGKEIATPKDMLEAIDKILPSLTTVPEAFGSRIGLVLITNKLKRVLVKHVPVQKIKENQLIVESIFELAIPKIKEIYKNEKVQAWLNEPLKDYKKKVEDLSNRFSEQLLFGERCKIFWLDQAEGYRHMRGFALEVALVDCIGDILNSEVITEELIETILERAEENLETVISINLDSLREMVDITEESEPVVKNIIVSRFESLKGYKKALVFAYALALANKKINPTAEFTVLNELAETYNEVDTEKLKEIFGSRYSLGFSTVVQAFEKLSPEAKKQLCQELETKFGLEISYSENQRIWIIKRINDTIEFLLDYVQGMVK